MLFILLYYSSMVQQHTNSGPTVQFIGQEREGGEGGEGEIEG